MILSVLPEISQSCSASAFTLVFLCGLWPLIEHDYTLTLPAGTLTDAVSRLRCVAGRDELENRSLASRPPRTAPAPPNGHTFLRFSMSGAESETTVGTTRMRRQPRSLR